MRSLRVGAQRVPQVSAQIVKQSLSAHHGKALWMVEWHTHHPCSVGSPIRGSKECTCIAPLPSSCEPPPVGHPKAMLLTLVRPTGQLQYGGQSATQALHTADVLAPRGHASHAMQTLHTAGALAPRGHTLHATQQTGSASKRPLQSAPRTSAVSSWRPTSRPAHSGSRLRATSARWVRKQRNRGPHAHVFVCVCLCKRFVVATYTDLTDSCHLAQEGKSCYMFQHGPAVVHKVGAS